MPISTISPAAPLSPDPASPPPLPHAAISSAEANSEAPMVVYVDRFMPVIPFKSHTCRMLPARSPSHSRPCAPPGSLTVEYAACRRRHYPAADTDSHSLRKVHSDSTCEQ